MTTRNRTPKSVENVNEVEKSVSENAVETVQKEENTVTKLPEKKTYAHDDGIMCQSVTEGWLGMSGIKSKIAYQWEAYGDETEVEYDDLVAAVRSQSSYVFNPLFIIEDQNFVKMYPQIQKVYDKIYSLSDLRDIFNLPNERMKSEIKKLPMSVQESVKTMAAKMIQEKSLDSISKIKTLDEIFGTQLIMMTD